MPATLFAARVALECTRRPRPGTLVVAIGLAAALAGAAIGCKLLRSSLLHSSLWLPLIYVLWPQKDSVVAASVATATALAWLLSRDVEPLPRWAARAADGAIFILALVVYVATAAPDVLPADSGEFQLAAARLGVAHPPGFPLYTMLGHLFIRLLPLGTPAYRLNLLSGVMAAGALVLTAAATRVWARRLGANQSRALVAGLAAAIALGTATTFWAQARIANIRTPSTLAVALTLYALARFADSSDRQTADRALLLVGLALGLGLGHHPSLAFAAAFYVAYVLATDPRLAAEPRRWWRLLFAIPVGVLPYLYLPIRGAMGAPLAPPRLDTLQGFLNHALARGFAGDMFAYVNGVDLPHRASLIPTLFHFQFNAALLVAALLGLGLLIRRDWRLFVLLGGSLAIHTFVTITYRAPQTVEYLMPAAYPVIAVAVGLCPLLLVAWRSFIIPPSSVTAGAFLSAGVILAGVLNGWAHGPSYAELASDRTARDTVAPLLDQAPSGSLVLSDWHWVTPMWYLQQVEGARPDVEVRYVYNVSGEHYRQTWRERIEEVPPDRSVLLTHYYEFDGYTTEPWGSGFLIRERPVAEPLAPIRPLNATFGDAIHVVGYSLRPSQARVGQPMEVTVAWQPLARLEGTPSLSVRLMNEAGDRVAQADRQLSMETEPGEVRFERVALPLYPFLASGEYRLTLGAYRASDSGFEDLTTPDGQPAVSLSPVELAPASDPPYTSRRRSVPFEGGAELVGVDYDRSVAGALRIYLQWRGPISEGVRALLEGPGGQSATVPLPATPAGAYQTVAIDMAEPLAGNLTVSLHGDEGPLAAAGPWGWGRERLGLPRTALDDVFIPLGEDIAVVGAAARPASPGGEMVIEAHLVGLNPLTTDYAISVRLTDEDGRWLARQDWQPALGAIPTLKWIRGSQVVDRHLLAVPEDFAGESTRAELVVYERFREAPLPPMDGRFGQAPLGAWPQPGAGERQ